MKRLLLICLAVLMFTVASAGVPTNGPRHSSISKCPNGHCAHLMENGDRCDKCALTNNPYCNSHSKPEPRKKATPKK